MTHRRPHFRPPPYSTARPGLVQPVAVDPAGAIGPTWRQAQGGAWRRSSRGLYVPRWTDATVPEQRIVEAAASVPAGAAVTGWAALRWLGGRWFDGIVGRTALPVPVLVGNHRIHGRAGIHVTAERLLYQETSSTVDGLLMTSAVRAVAYEARYAADLRAAVQVLDMAAAADLVSVAEVRAYAARLVAWTGIDQLRRALELADENVWSPMETEMAMIWVLDLGLARPLCNRPIFDLTGRHVATPDLLDVEAGVMGEYDGAIHLEGKQRTKDLAREADARRLGLEYVTMTAGDRADPSAYRRRVVEARQRGLRRRGPRLWTVEEPPWWTPTYTVAQRRALTAEQRARFLRRDAG